MSKKPVVQGMSRSQRAAVMISIREQHSGRSPRAVSMDARQTARRSLDPETDDLHPWQRNPNRYDVAGVDTLADAVAEKKPEAKHTEPKTAAEVKKWIEEKSKEYGGRHKFLSSDEYKAAYPKKKEKKGSGKLTTFGVKMPGIPTIEDFGN